MISLQLQHPTGITISPRIFWNELKVWSRYLRTFARCSENFFKNRPSPRKDDRHGVKHKFDVRQVDGFRYFQEHAAIPPARLSDSHASLTCERARYKGAGLVLALGLALKGEP